jgi:phosphatidylserine decarboxylase
MKLTKYGLKEWLGGGIIASILIVACLCLVYCYQQPATGYSIAGFILLIYIGIAAFFRDPHRKIPPDSNVLVSPADGVIRDIELLKDAEENSFFDGNGIVRVGIFLSVLDVHLNRAPCDIDVKKQIYRKGKYHDARNPLASKENEAMTISCTASVKNKSFPIMVRQISGAIAKRIVCNADEGKQFSKGERFGMIKFGSRTELFLPAEQWITLSVKVGDRVFAGKSIIAKVKSTDSNNPSKTDEKKLQKTD